MFGRWISGANKAGSPSQARVRDMARHIGLPDSAVAQMAGGVEVKSFKPGLIEHLPSDTHWAFLDQGSLQIQTQHNAVITLKADAPMAAYPLPKPDAVVSLFAPQAVRLLCVPRKLAVPQSPMPMALGDLQLTPQELSAWERLQASFRQSPKTLLSMPDLAMKIGRAIDDANNANDDIARLIQLDPALATRMLAVVNSAAFRGVSKISSIQQATSRLGRSRVRSLVYSCLLKNTFQSDSRALRDRMHRLWQHSTHVAALSCVLARDTPGLDQERALFAGLIHDIGAVAVLNALQDYPELYARSAVLEATLARFRVPVGVNILRRWGLGDELEGVVRDAEQWQRLGSAIPELPDVVLLAQLHAYIGHSLQRGLPAIDQVPAFSKLARGELTPHHSLALLDEAETDVQEIKSLIQAA